MKVRICIEYYSLWFRVFTNGVEHANRINLKCLGMREIRISNITPD